MLSQLNPFMGIRPGDRVVILSHNGGIGRNVTYVERTGRAVMVFTNHAVLNMGGRHGTPAVANERNFVRIAGRRK